MDVDFATGEKIERNRAEGRLCLAATSTGRPCTQRAKVKILEIVWPTRVGEGGAVASSSLVMCRRHANMYKPGFTGVNFQIIGHEEF